MKSASVTRKRGRGRGREREREREEEEEDDKIANEEKKDQESRNIHFCFV